MKVFIYSLPLLLCSKCIAFQHNVCLLKTQSTRLHVETPTSSSSSSSSSSRREWIQSTLTGSLALVLVSQLQQQPALAEQRELWLTEPTDEFKANEAKATEFKRAQLVLKGEFNKVLDRFTLESNTEEQLVTDLQDLRTLVQKTGGLPLGVKKEELVKIIRRKKASGFWPVPVEYA